MPTRCSIMLGSVLLVLAPGAVAQSETNSDLDRQVQQMRRQVTEGRVLRSHVRVTVRLKNGNRIKGIVKDGFLVERVEGLRFVAAEKDEPGAGIRVYYWDGTTNYVFLPFADVREYSVNERLSSAELKLIEMRALREQQEREAQQRAASPAPVAPGGETQPPAGQTGGVPAPVPDEVRPDGGLSEQQKELFELLQEYPVQAGWNEAKRDEIMHRRAVVGVNPTPQELRFVERFSDWQRACTMFGVKPVEEKPEGEPEEGVRRRPRRR
jgi:hypothetical protein